MNVKEKQSLTIDFSICSYYQFMKYSFILFDKKIESQLQLNDRECLMQLYEKCKQINLHLLQIIQNKSFKNGII